MSVTRWMNPTTDLWQATRAFDRLFDEFLGGSAQPGSSQPGKDQPMPTYLLPVDIVEAEDRFVITASVPGIAPENVEVTYDDGVLTISAQAVSAEVKGTWLRQERPQGSWVRRLQVPQQVEPEGISAAFDHGVLTVAVPKASRPQPVRIAVNGAQAPAKKALKS